MTREEEIAREVHIAWCKDRALEYLNAGDLPNAFTSMVSDMGELSQTAISRSLIRLGLLHVTEKQADDLRQWIERFR